ncbi:MAG TPA: tRNA (guanosine(46)-N7)-methyltransferase TrmB [Myxococcales bacterium]|nr:tRNA (guanosine(46)-N7)-methyltransferase TrmB [Myxococcales bacterium]
MIVGCAQPGETWPDWGERPIEVEVGPGHGGFALDHATKHPDRLLVVIETRRSDCELIRMRADKRGLANLHVVQGDARLLLPRMFRDGQLWAVHVQFPDPWWKKRHHKRRMVDVEFAQLMRRLLRPGGLIDFRTDVPAYFREALQTWLEAGFVRLPDAAPEVLSTRERRYAVTGQPVFRAAFENPAAPVAAPPSERTGRDWRDTRRK